MMKKNEIIKRAEEFCNQHHINKYPVNIVDICNNLGIKVFEEYLPANVSGFIGIDSLEKSFQTKYKTDAVIVVNLADSAKRRRFTIAHELAHYVLHKGEDEKLYAHRDVVDTPQRGIEREANIFASNILMPKELVEHALDILQEEMIFSTFEEKVEYIADHFKVSKQAARVRLEELAVG